jgi:predicted permease
VYRADALERVLNASLTLRQNRYPEGDSRVAAFDRIKARIADVPGVESVTFTSSWPVQQPNLQPIEAQGARSRAAIHAVGDTYFATLGIPLSAGRTFTDADRRTSEPVAVVSESLARRLWPGTGAIGNRLSFPLPQEREAVAPAARLIVGVVRDVRQHPTDADLADVYVPMRQAPNRFAFALIRTAGEPSGHLPAIRAALREVDPEIAADRARPLQAALDEVTARPRFLAALLASFASVAVLLALVGMYGVIAYAVRQREREIAIRLAVGANPSRITRLFVRQGSLLLACGLVLGTAGALAAGRMIESQLVGITPRDPLALAIAVGAFAAAALIAIWWPSRRAAATDPALALRLE